MDEEILLKNTFLGGYKKKEVLAFLDSVSEKHEEETKQLEEKMMSLTKENSWLKKQLDAAKKESTVPDENAKTGQPLEEKAVHFLRPVINDAEYRDKMSIRQQMELPEGIYLVPNDHSILNLPEPSPVYHSKEKITAATLQPEIQDKPSSSVSLHEDEGSDETAAIEAAATEQTKVLEGKNKEALPPQPKAAADEYSGLKFSERHLPESIEELQNKVRSLKLLLDKERHEKQIIAAKLEFSSDFLLQLYKK